MNQNNTTLIVPKTTTELFSLINKYPKAILLAGGTHLMHSNDFYHHTEHHYIIALDSVNELKKILHADRYVEVGSMVTIQQLLTSGGFNISSPLYKAFEKIGSSILRNKITLGGSLCIPQTRYSLSCIFSTIQAQAEIRFISSSGFFNRFKVKSRWIPVSKLYDSNGSFLYSDNAVLTKIRIPYFEGNIQNFTVVGDPSKKPENAIIMGFQYSISQDSVVSPSFCITLLKNGFFYNNEFNSILRTIKFPLSTKSILKISTELIKIIRQDCPMITDMQLERSRRVLVSTLLDSNNFYISF